ncbi:hypothetical protein V8F06_003661 [Rhypophila decipiens]
MGSMLPLTAILNPSGGEQESSFTPRPSPSTAINFYPFEDLGEASVREIRKYQIHSLGRIRDSCRRIPYNTGKRDFYEKTGRTYFEVFQYDFKIPGSDTTWTVMWDYKIGLVRTTPFFKCCDYSKTISAKMLNQNPGLRDISHSITGGAIRAQGYWMPFECARAVCATFCYPIAGALIPLFGPKFPSECIPPNTQHYARMTISPAIIQRSKREAEEFRRLYGNMPSPPTHSLPSSTRPTHGHASYRAVGASPALAYHHHHGGWQTGTDSDAEGSSLDRFPRLPPLQTAHLPTPALSSAESSYNASSTAQSSPRFWTAVNHPRDTRGHVYPPQYASSYSQHEWHSKSRYHHLEPDPYRSAVSSPPTSSGTTSHHQFYHQPVLPLPSSTTREAPPPPRESQRQVLPPYRPPGGTAFRAVNSSSSFSPSQRHGDSKRPFDDYYDHDYDAGESANGSSPEAPSPKVFHGSSSKAQVQVQSQSQSNIRHHSKPVEARRCSLVVAVAGSDTSSLGRGKNNTSSSSSEESSDRTTSESEEERDRDARRRPLVDRYNSTLAPMVGGVYQPSRRDSSGGRSCPKSPHTKNDRTTSGAAATRSDDDEKTTKRTPSFSGAERVAALTLLHLGILDKEKKEHAHANSKDHSSRQQQSQAAAAAARGSSSPPREVGEKSHGRSPRPRPQHDDTHTPYPYGESIYAIPSRRTPKESYTRATEEEVSESTTTTTAHASSIPRRGSRDRKRRKGRSI